jgi:muconolactone delta-isomerase
MEYRVAVTIRVHEGTPAEAVDVIHTREAAHSRGLAERGQHLLRPCRPPWQLGEWATLGLFAGADGGQPDEILMRQS